MCDVDHLDSKVKNVKPALLLIVLSAFTDMKVTLCTGSTLKQEPYNLFLKEKWSHL